MPVNIPGMTPSRVEETLPNGLIRVTVTPPPATKIKGSSVDLTREQLARYHAWLGGAGLLQYMLPDLSPDQREILQTGIGPEDWDRLFPPEDE